MAPTLDTLITAILPPTRTVRFTQVTVEQETIHLQLTATAPTATCPGCARPSSAVHSRYQRHVTDLSWGPLAVRMQLFVRKFVCRNPNGVRRIFSERLPGLVATYARNTCRLVTALQAIGVALGGNAGARTVCRFITQLRRASEAGDAPEPQDSPYTSRQGPSARCRSSWYAPRPSAWMMRRRGPMR
jgi:transposase